MKGRLIEDYNKYKAFFSEVSYDKENKISLINDRNTLHKVYNFDAISDAYCKMLRGEKYMSCDAYYQKNSGEAYLIEFKNQEEGNIDKRNIKNKIHDSVATLVMNEDVPRECVTDKITVIIVYNNEVHDGRTESSYMSSEAYDGFSKKMAELSGMHGLDTYPKKFDLEKYQGFLFKDVYTIGKRAFEEDFVKWIFDK
jgi:hypothetical protein